MCPNMSQISHGGITMLKKVASVYLKFKHLSGPVYVFAKSG